MYIYIKFISPLKTLKIEFLSLNDLQNFSIYYKLFFCTFVEILKQSSIMLRCIFFIILKIYFYCLLTIQRNLIFYSYSHPQFFFISLKILRIFYEIKSKNISWIRLIIYWKSLIYTRENSPPWIISSRPSFFFLFFFHFSLFEERDGRMWDTHPVPLLSRFRCWFPFFSSSPQG